MGKRLLERDYIKFTDYLVNNEDCLDSERHIPLLNFVEKNFYKNKYIIKEIKTALRVVSSPQEQNIYNPFLEDVEERIFLWTKQKNIEFNMDLKYLKVLRLHIGFIDFKTLSRRHLKERLDIVETIKNRVDL